MKTLIAKDTMNITSVQSENIFAGDKFEIDDASAKDLIERGLAKEAPAAKSEKTDTKAADTPENTPAKSKTAKAK